MKQIQLPVFMRVNVDVDPTTGQGSTECTPEEYHKYVDRGMAVVKSTLAIESLLNWFLRLSLFREIDEDAEFVCGHLLESSHLSFSSKRKLFSAILERDSLLSGKEKQNIEKQLSFVERYRNAFAHGSISAVHDKFILKYFSSTHHEENLDDDFWLKIETSFNQASNTIQALNVQLSATQTDSEK